MKSISLLALALSILFARAQQPLSADLAIGSNGSQVNLSVSLIKPFSIGGKFTIGPGIRAGGQRGSDLRYLTAPASLTANEANYDTLHFPTASTLAINLSLNLGFQFSQKLGAGFNIDAAGVTFGGKQNGLFHPGPSARAQSRSESTVMASPTPVNLLLVGDNDRGTLNSELFVKLSLTEKLGLRAGGSFLFTEYTTETLVGVDNNDRFRNKAMMGFLAVRYSL